MNLTKLLTVSTRETLIFSKMVDEIHKKRAWNRSKQQSSNENKPIFH